MFIGDQEGVEKFQRRIVSYNITSSCMYAYYILYTCVLGEGNKAS